jgi:CBS domain-containing protein
LPTDDITSAEAAMARAQVRRLPVVDGQGRAIGILTMNDIARACANGGKRTAAAVTTTLAAICAPRARALVKAA